MVNELRFLKSTIIYMEDIVKVVEYNLYKSTGNLSKKREETKFWLNIQGLKHPLDPDIYILSPDTGEYTILNKDTIKEQPVLESKLREFGETYDSIIRQYPTMSIYIKGLLNPVTDINIDVKDGDILTYEKTLLTDDNDMYLYHISRLARKIINSRYVRYYNVDQGYISSFYATLYSYIVKMLPVIKIGYNLSVEAFTDQIDLYFKSYKNMSIFDYEFIPREDIIWLYGELKNIVKSNANNEAFDKIVKRIYDKNNIPIYNLEYYKVTPKLIEENIDDPRKDTYKYSYLFKKNKITTTGNNIVYNYDLTDVIDEETKSGYINDELTDMELSNYDNTLKKQYNSNTKDFSFVLNNNIDLTNKVSPLMLNKTGLNGVDIVLPYVIIHLLDNLKTTINVLYTNPNSGKIYTLNNQDILVLTTYLLLKTIGKYNDNKVIEYDNLLVLKDDVDIDKLIEGNIYGKFVKDIIKDIYDTLPFDMNISKGSDLEKYYKRYMNGLGKIIYYVTNTSDPVLSTVIKDLSFKLFQQGNVTLELDTTLEEYIHNNIDRYFAFNTLNYVSDLESLLYQTTGININYLKQIINRAKKYIEFIDKFKSYTIKFTYSFYNKDILFVDYRTPEIGKHLFMYGKINSGWYKKFYKFYIELKTYLSTLVDRLYILSPTADITLLTEKVKLECLYNIINSYVLVSEYRVPDIYRPKLREISSLPGYLGSTVIDNKEIYTLEEQLVEDFNPVTSNTYVSKEGIPEPYKTKLVKTSIDTILENLSIHTNQITESNTALITIAKILNEIRDNDVYITEERVYDLLKTSIEIHNVLDKMLTIDGYSTDVDINTMLIKLVEDFGDMIKHTYVSKEGIAIPYKTELVHATVSDMLETLTKIHVDNVDTNTRLGELKALLNEIRSDDTTVNYDTVYNKIKALLSAIRTDEELNSTNVSSTDTNDSDIQLEEDTHDSELFEPVIYIS